MEITLLATLIFGLICISLSLENDSLRKNVLKSRKTEEDRLYKLSVIKETQLKIAYTSDPEKAVDIIMASLRNLFKYSVASSITLKDEHIIFKIYIEEKVGQEYIRKIEENMLASYRKLVGRVPARINRRMYGNPVDNTSKSIYSSSFHMPIIANNKVLALIHLSSIKDDIYSNMEDLRELIDTASSALTHFNQAVETETEKFSSLIASINDGILMTDDSSHLLAINASAKNILNLPKYADFPDIAGIFGQNFELEHKINKVVLSKDPYFEKEVQVNSKTLNIFINPIGNDKVSIVLRDVTDYKKKELMKEDLTHIMVHELRSPITTIKDSAELMITNGDSLGEDKKIKFLQIIHQQAKKVLGQIGSILDTAKLDAGKLVLQKTKGSIEKLIGEEVEVFMPQAERRNISLEFARLTEFIPEFSFDEIRIRQAIDNLLSNSLKFTPENGKVKVELDYKVISPVLDGVSPMKEFLSLDKFIVVSVSDTGSGISPEQQKFLFSKYTQAKNTSEKIATQGTGLGLYLVKGIVESHKGRIWVKSAQGQGTTFSFSLPATVIAAVSTQASYGVPQPTAAPISKYPQAVN